jgi:hypothetical protein
MCCCYIDFAIFYLQKFFLVSDIILSGVVNLCSVLFLILVWCSTCGSKTKEKGKIKLDWSIFVFLWQYPI